MFWGGFAVGMLFLFFTCAIGWVSWGILENHIGKRIREGQPKCEISKFQVDVLQIDVSHLMQDRDRIMQFKDRVDKELSELSQTLSAESKRISVIDDTQDDLIDAHGELEAKVPMLEDEITRLDNRMNSVGATRHETQRLLDKRFEQMMARMAILEKTDDPLYYGVILADGCAVHETPEKGSPISHVLNKDTRVMIYEIEKNNGVNWARIEEEGWIHGGWEYRHPPRIQGSEKG